MRRVIVVVIALVAVLVVADFATAAVAESTVSRQMRDRLGLPEDPSVRVNGVSFLTQAAAGRYPSVEVSMQRLPVGSLHTREVKVRLHDLRAPFSDLAGAGQARFRVTDAESIVTIGAGDVMRALPGTKKLTLTTVNANDIDALVQDGADPTLRGVDPRNATRITTTTTVRGTDQTIEVLAVLQITGDGLIRITPRDVRATGTLVGSDDLTATEMDALTREFTLLIDPGRLPFKITPTTLRIDDTGALELSGQAKDLVFGEGDRSASAQS